MQVYPSGNYISVIVSLSNYTSLLSIAATCYELKFLGLDKRKNLV